ncbi:hypothetical protein JVT61DRAFT_6269 [Boletus reticuloceps]|uniref:Uncharacterized protein n=1 Tax=Boletus reticuloceps TaxID=495285 RepID=A0A8I3A6K7_9AGAM|nr:hypothetical protein JVT61DRAFT_6269 [Boletus reticuloceps]
MVYMHETEGLEIGPINPQTTFNPESLPFCNHQELLSGHGSLTPQSPVSTLTSSDNTSATTDSLPCPGSESISLPPLSQILYPTPTLHDALELCFFQKKVRGGAGSGVSLGDIEKIGNLLAQSIRASHLSDAVLQEAVLVKEAGCEMRYLCVMALVWELKEAEHYQKLLCSLHQHDQVVFKLFNALIDLVNDLIYFKHHKYLKELISMAVSDLQLNILKLEAQACLDVHGGKNMTAAGSD